LAADDNICYQMQEIKLAKRVIARRNDVAIPYLQSSPTYRGLLCCARNNALGQRRLCVMYFSI